MSSTEEYQQAQFWKKTIEDFKKEKDLILQDLILFGECAYTMEPEFKRIDPRTIDTTEYEGRD